MKTRNALVTGGAQGLGFAISKRLAEDGCIVTIADKILENAEKAVADLTAAGHQGRAVQVDVTVDESVKKCISALDRIDVLVNNAGIYSEIAFEELTMKDFQTMMDVNLIGIFAVTQAALPILPQASRVVNIASRAALGGIGMAHYAASKGAVVSLTRSMAMEFLPRKITVNAVSPGFILTPMTRALPSEVIAERVKLQPGGALGDPSDIANAVCFFASENSRFITGQTLIVDGGRSLGVSNTL